MEALLAAPKEYRPKDEVLIEKLNEKVMPKMRKQFEVSLLNQFDKRLARLQAFGERWPEIASTLLRKIHQDGAISRPDLEQELDVAGITGKNLSDFTEILREDAFIVEEEHGAYQFGDRIVGIWLDRRYGAKS